MSIASGSGSSGALAVYVVKESLAVSTSSGTRTRAGVGASVATVALTNGASVSFLLLSGSVGLGGTVPPGPLGAPGGAATSVASLLPPPSVTPSTTARMRIGMKARQKQKRIAAHVPISMMRLGMGFCHNGLPLPGSFIKLPLDIPLFPIPPSSSSKPTSSKSSSSSSSSSLLTSLLSSSPLSSSSSSSSDSDPTSTSSSDSSSSDSSSEPSSDPSSSKLLSSPSSSLPSSLSHSGSSLRRPMVNDLLLCASNLLLTRLIDSN
mmetsp:Transcript_18400/g.42003  ORF Transcript_18400/g.42003 Transcript_18400/m.42003 type:complete len:263 (+) Transcript_18400:359-1147(+)